MYAVAGMKSPGPLDESRIPLCYQKPKEMDLAWLYREVMEWTEDHPV